MSYTWRFRNDPSVTLQGQTYKIITFTFIICVLAASNQKMHPSQTRIKFFLSPVINKRNFVQPLLHAFTLSFHSCTNEINGEYYIKYTLLIK
jgi:hypothetical protein